MERAQDTFAALVRVSIGPALRSIGLRGSGRSFTLPDDRWWLLVGIQASRSSDLDRLEFTVNLSAASKERWEAIRQRNAWIGARPTGNSRYAVRDLVEVVRIGSLMPDGRDTWWEVRAGRDAEAIAREVVAAVATYGLPWLRARAESGGSDESRQ
jgi:hypothetical protein